MQIKFFLLFSEFMKRIEAILNKAVWPIAKKFAKKYKKQELWLSAAVLALDRLSVEERDKALDEASNEQEHKLEEFRRLFLSMNDEEKDAALANLNDQMTHRITIRAAQDSSKATDKKIRGNSAKTKKSR